MVSKSPVKVKNILADELSNAALLYTNNKREAFTRSNLGKKFRKNIPETLIREGKLNVQNYKVVGSIGKGQYAEVAWVSIFNVDMTKSATRGVYIVYLLSVDGKSIYLSLNQGYTYFGKKYTSKNARIKLSEMADALRKEVSKTNSKYTEQISLGATKTLAKGYESGNIWALKYDVHKMPDDKELIKDLQDMLKSYNKIISLCSGRSIEAFYDYLNVQKEGLINLTIVEEEIRTDNIPEDFTPKVMYDKPEEKKEPVVDSGGVVRYPRDPYVAANSIQHSNYSCCYDNSHKTFTSKGTSHMYVEAHHLIPIKANDKFVNSIDVESNICALCSTCHDCIHHGIDELKGAIIKKLYTERKDRLSSAGIPVSLEQLYKYYGIE